MTVQPAPVVAWVESPLQLLGAAEWAADQGRRIAVAGRLTPQMPETADELLARGASFGERAPFLGIPWKMLSRHKHWLVGDGFSGQFRVAASLLRPERVTFLDDGANIVAFAEALVGRRSFSRPGIVERGLTARAAPFMLDLILSRARTGNVDIFTAFPFGESLVAELAERGCTVSRHTFAWTRRTARAYVTKTNGRILLGSARPVDGRMPLGEYLDWVGAEAARAPVTYLPHRREPETQLLAVAAIAGVHVDGQSLPVEMVLSGAIERLEIVTLPSSTTTTLPLVLRPECVLRSVPA